MKSKLRVSISRRFAMTVCVRVVSVEFDLALGKEMKLLRLQTREEMSSDERVFHVEYVHDPAYVTVGTVPAAPLQHA